MKKRQALLCRDTPLMLVSEEIDEAPDGALPQWFPLLEKARRLALSRLEAPELPLWERLGFLLALGELLQPCVDEELSTGGSTAGSPWGK